MSRLLIPNTCQVPNVVLDKVIPRLPAGAVRVLLAIVRFTYGFGKASDRISYGQLSKATRLSRRQVIHAVKALGNLINVVQGAKGRGANEYSLNLNIATGRLLSSEQDFTSEENRTGEVSRTGVVPKTAPFQTHISKPNKSGAKVPEISPSRRERKLTRSDPPQVEAFARFYSAYPRHVAREVAQKTWLELSPSPELQMLIMAGVARWAAENEGVEKKFIPHPATWLNGRRWEDEPAAGGNGDGPPKIVKREGDMLTLADGSIMPVGTYQRKHGISP